MIFATSYWLSLQVGKYVHVLSMNILWNSGGISGIDYSKDNSGTFWRYIPNEYFLAIYYCTGEMDKLWRIETSCYVTNATFCDRRICDEMRRRRTSQIIVAFGHFCDHLWLRQFKSFWPVLFLVVFDFALSTQSQWKILKKLYQHAAISMSHTRRHCDRRIVDGASKFPCNFIHFPTNYVRFLWLLTEYILSIRRRCPSGRRPAPGDLADERTPFISISCPPYQRGNQPD